MKTNPAMINTQQPHPDDVLDWEEVQRCALQPLPADADIEPITQ